MSCDTIDRVGNIHHVVCHDVILLKTVLGFVKFQPWMQFSFSEFIGVFSKPYTIILRIYKISKVDTALYFVRKSICNKEELWNFLNLAKALHKHAYSVEQLKCE